jgi:hypothetical protein
VLPQHAAAQRRRGRPPRPRLAGHGRQRLREGRHLRGALPLARRRPANHNAQYLPVGTTGGATPSHPAKKFKVAAFDYGAKYTIFRKLVRHGFEVQVFPATATARAGARARPDGVFLSNGPGDPAALPYIHQTVTALLPDFRSSASASATR